MKSHRALSSIVGTVFLVAIVISALSYVSYSLDTMGNYSELLISEESRLNEKKQEVFEVQSITNNSASKLDGVIKNTGEIPVKLTTLWIDEQGVNDVVQKFTLDSAISPGNSVNLINLVDYTIDPAKGYNMKVVSSRGEVNSFYVNSPNQQPLDLRLDSLPKTIPDEFESTLLLSVRNNMTNDNLLMNLKPVDPLTIVPNDVNTIVTKVDGPIPASYPSLKPGETAVFKWTYTVKGDTDDYAEFTAQLENGFAGNTATDRITIGEIKLATDAVTSFSSQGFNPLSSSTQDLILHQENLLAPLSSAYQMDQKLADAAGTSLSIKTTSPDFYTNNGTAVEISPGKWNATLTYMSAAFPDSLATSMDAKGGIILHFDDGGAGIDGNEDNSFNCVSDTGKAKFAQYQGGMSVSNWNQFGGPQGSGSYSFDGVDDFFSVERAKCNEVKKDLATIAGWFKASSSGSGNDYIYYAGKDNGATAADRFSVKIDSSNNVVFEFETDDDTALLCASSGTNYRDNSWHHFVGVRDADYSCKLYLDGNTTPAATDTNSGGNKEIKLDKHPLIGARLTQKDIPSGGDFFQGSLDDIMYWQNYALSATEVSDLYNTNYGNAAHTITFTYSRTDPDGVNLGTITNDIAYPMNFSDGKRDGKFLKSFNYTSLLPLTTIGAQERLKFEMLYVDFVEALQMTLRIDDNSLTTNPQNSAIDLPPTNATFQPFQIYDNNSELTASVVSNGPFGSWITKGGTRAIFNDTASDLSYGALIKSVNGTILTENQDSTFVAIGDGVDLIFHRPKLAPDNCWPPGGSCDTGLIPPGLYNAQILIVGYNDEGNENTWKISMGNIQVN